MATVFYDCSGSDSDSNAVPGLCSDSDSESDPGQTSVTDYFRRKKSMRDHRKQDSLNAAVHLLPEVRNTICEDEASCCNPDFFFEVPYAVMSGTMCVSCRYLLI